MSNIYRRGKVWWGCAIRQGRKYRRSLKTADRAIAERRFRQWLGELDAIAWGDKPRRTFEETTERFFREHLPTLKRRGSRALHQQASSISRLISTGRPWIRSRAQSCQHSRPSGVTDGVAPPTIRLRLARLSSVMTSATDWGWIEDGSNPAPSYLRRRASRGLKEAPARNALPDGRRGSRADRSCDDGKPAHQGWPSGSKWTCARAIILAIDTGLTARRVVRPVLGPDRHQAGDHHDGHQDQKRPGPQGTAAVADGTNPDTPAARDLESDFVCVNPNTGHRYVQQNRGAEGGDAPGEDHGAAVARPAPYRGLPLVAGDRKSMEEVSILLGHSSVAGDGGPLCLPRGRERRRGGFGGPHKNRPQGQRTSYR